MSDSVRNEFKDKVDWYSISAYQTLSEDFIREFNSGRNQVHWDWISQFQILSDSVRNELKDKVDWIGISFSQKLSEDFIREFKDKVDWEGITSNQQLSDSVRNEFNWMWISRYCK